MKRESIPWVEIPSPAAPGGREGYVDEERRSPKVTTVEGNDDGNDGGGHKRRWWLWILAALLALALVAAALWWFGLWPFGGSDEEQAGPSNELVPVSVSAVELEEIPVYYEYNGLTYASRQAEIRPRVSGYIEEIAFREGARVERDQLLYRLDARPFEAALAQAEAELNSTEASLAFAEAQVARFSELADEGYATGERYDQALARREELQGQVAAIEARLQSARLNRQYTEVRAPFAGRAGLTRLNEGELASPGGPALTSVVQLDPLEVRFEIRDQELSRIRLAMLGDEPLRVVALLEEDQAYADYGVLDALDNTIDPGTGTMTAQALFPNPNELLPAGRFFDLRLLLGRAEAVVIPTSALSTNLDRRIVYRVGPEGQAVGTPVEIGRRIRDRVVVVSGLAPGDRIVTSNLQSVRDGTPLDVPFPQPPAAPQPPRTAGGEARAVSDEALARPAPLAPARARPDAGPSGADLVVAPAGGPDGAGGPGAEVPLVGERPTGAGAPSPDGGLGEIIPQIDPNPRAGTALQGSGPVPPPTSPGAPAGGGPPSTN